MNASRRRHFLARRALGPLLCAWLCANLPVTAGLQLLAWLQGAEHFSHTAALRTDVSRLLADASAQPAPAPVARQAAPVPRRTAPLPPSPTLSREDWAPTESFALQPPAPRTGSTSTRFRPAPPGPAADVPHPPPRRAAIA